MKYFKDKEDFKGNMDKMDPKLLIMLDELREEYGQPIILNSSEISSKILINSCILLSSYQPSKSMKKVCKY